tara:strand:- start:433 stop:549 length:117 start_codon:yes stop_codon:yes gene_type:complete
MNSWGVATSTEVEIHNGQGLGWVGETLVSIESHWVASG